MGRARIVKKVRIVRSKRMTHKLNEMMDKPIIKESVLNYMREALPKFSGIIGELEEAAHRRRVPIIPHETATYIDQLLSVIRPEKILEVGTAIGFSALLMAQYAPVDTIERNPVMVEEAKENFQRSNSPYAIQLLEGDAKGLLEKVEGPYDVIFLDSAKAKYIEFLPRCLELLADNGVILIDDIFQGGTVFDDDDTIPRRVRKIHRNLNALLEKLTNDPMLKVSFLPLGDGLAMINKRKIVKV